MKYNIGQELFIGPNRVLIAGHQLRNRKPFYLVDVEDFGTAVLPQRWFETLAEGATLL